LYDPAQSAYWYSWTPSDSLTDAHFKYGTFTPYDASYPVGYLNFYGRWGDAKYPDKDARQRVFKEKYFKYVDGPTGPGDKNIGRKDVWSGSNHKIWDKLVP
jgi:hypothetical protein